MQCFYIFGLVKNEEVQVLWNPGQENLGDYASKNHDTKHYQQVIPMYLHELNSPRMLPRATKPRILRGCVGTIPGGYICGRPLHMYGGTPNYVKKYRTLEDPET